MTSFIVPAHNEEAHLPATLAAIHASARALDLPYEVIVVDDASTDRTAAVAREHGARVVAIDHRHLAAARNAGAREARGDVLFFVDADTRANPAAVRAGLLALRGGAAGGGCVFRFDCPLPAWGKLLYPVGILAGRLLKVVGGCFLFCTRQAFEAVGGFPERLYAAEEVAFIDSLKRQGRFVVPGPSVITSGRKLDRISAAEAIRIVVRYAARREESFTSRRHLDLWYGDRSRPSPPPPPRSHRAVWCD